MTRTGTIFVATILILVGSWSGASAQTTGKKAVGKAPADTKAPAETKAPVETKAPAEAKAPAEPKADPDAELAAIRAQSEAFVAAFNGQDAKALAALWTKNGEYLDESGRRLNGREEIEKGYAEFFANNPGVKIQVTLDAVNLLSPTTAVEDGHAVALRTETSPPSLSRYTVIHVKVDGNWLMASVRDTNIETPAPDSSSKDLEWLIGTWVTEDHGVKVESVCSWVVDGRFLERKYTTTQLDGTQSSGVQLIGWNPLGGHVQSWSFSPDGGHAVGIWIPAENGWIAHVRGTTGDGIPTTSINEMTRLDDNASVWKSYHRTVGNKPLPDTDDVIWKRQPAAK